MNALPPALSAVLKGVSFEHRALNVLKEHLSMSLRRVGGKGDGGIDLQGWWWLPPAALIRPLSSSDADPRGAHQDRTPVRILAQCKAEEMKIGPRYIREFEGAVLRYSAYLASNQPPPTPHGTCAPRDPFVGMFTSTSPFTKASYLQAYSSPIPLTLLHLPKPMAKSSHLPQGSLIFNPALNSSSSLLHGTFEAWWEHSAPLVDRRPRILTAICHITWNLYAKSMT